jgi:hypothetical protein
MSSQRTPGNPHRGCSDLLVCTFKSSPSLSAAPFSLRRYESAGRASALQALATVGVVAEPRFCTCLRLIYHCGLCIGEAVQVQISQIHGRKIPARTQANRPTRARSITISIDASVDANLFWLGRTVSYISHNTFLQTVWKNSLCKRDTSNSRQRK